MRNLKASVPGSIVRDDGERGLQNAQDPVYFQLAASF
jgi:hypothetical protein